jgi:hypothetical protein
MGARRPKPTGKEAHTRGSKAASSGGLIATRPAALDAALSRQLLGLDRERPSFVVDPRPMK